MSEILLMYSIFATIFATVFCLMYIRLYKEYRGDWGQWSDIKVVKVPARRDEDGEMLKEYHQAYQERYHDKTNKYKMRIVR